MNAFQSSDPFQNAPAKIRLSLRKLNLDAPPILKVKVACEGLKLSFQLPYWSEAGTCWAHFGMPKHKTVIVIGYTLAWINSTNLRPVWEAQGYKFLSITSKTVMGMRDDVLMAQLKQAVEMKEVKK